MSRHNFTHAERYAIFTVHRERCWLCNAPLSLNEVQVDHIIPERLEDHPTLPEVLRQLGRPADFQINSFENWMPAHGECNRIKAGLVFEPSPMIQARLQFAAERAAKARELTSKYGADRRIDHAIQELLAAHEQGVLSEEHRNRLAHIVIALHDENRQGADRGRPLLIAPWLEIVGEESNFVYLRGPGGMVGARVKGEKVDPSWDCPRCGPTAWNGTRCVICGMMDDGD